VGCHGRVLAEAHILTALWGDIGDVAKLGGGQRLHQCRELGTARLLHTVRGTG